MSREDREMVTVLCRGCHLGKKWATRVSNQTLSIWRDKVSRGDGVYLEDRYGHRYAPSSYNEPGSRTLYFELF